MAATAVGLTLGNGVRAVAGGRRVERIGSSVADSTDDEQRATRERRERAPHQQSSGDDSEKKQEGSDGAEAATGKGHVDLNEHIETTAAGTHAKSARGPRHATAPEPWAHAAAGHQRREEQERRKEEERRQRGRSGGHDDERQEAADTTKEETSRHDGGGAQCAEGKACSGAEGDEGGVDEDAAALSDGREQLVLGARAARSASRRSNEAADDRLATGERRTRGSGRRAHEARCSGGGGDERALFGRRQQIGMDERSTRSA
jgi:hypothetical protein